ncbi:hypothetical protein BCD48_42490 [Pseudofrankia sp. BMG5.36]|nr:hypothetical protein BCD48_42490 [Pseudofrankia sp. BMG5.36]
MPALAADPHGRAPRRRPRGDARVRRPFIADEPAAAEAELGEGNRTADAVSVLTRTALNGELTAFVTTAADQMYLAVSPGRAAAARPEKAEPGFDSNPGLTDDSEESVNA